MNIDFQNDIAIIDGEKIKLCCTTTGHYCIPVSISDLDRKEVKFVMHLESIANLNEKQKMSKELNYIYNSRMLRDEADQLLKDGGCDDTEFLGCIKQVCNKL